MIRGKRYSVEMLALVVLMGELSSAADVKLVQRKPDPYGAPRPVARQQHVPLESSFYIELASEDESGQDRVLPESVTIRLQPAGGMEFGVLTTDRRFAKGYTGRLFPANDQRRGKSLVVYVDSQAALIPSTTYTIRVAARSASGGRLSAEAGTWEFTTQQKPAAHRLEFSLDVGRPAVSWRGAFFSGFCKPSFCTSHDNLVATHELMDQVRQTSPRAWSLQRDFWMTGMDTGPTLLSPRLPSIVRERETRRVTSVEIRGDEVQLTVEDFFGHQQYGIPSGRPVSDDYHPGDEVLVADGKNHATAAVVGTDDASRTVRVRGLKMPEAGWNTAYSAPLPAQEDANAPGLFPPGGCLLRKQRPSGTPVYYWQRLDREWDLAHRQFKRRLMPNFADAPGDLAIDGSNWTTAKDYAELHEVVRAISGHIIDRYGDAALEFPWSVFNEPDLGALFWRTDWNELQKFYDYTVDGVLRAFEDRGYDSHRVFIGGLELGAIFGTNLRLRDFLAHCSPRGEAPGALPRNAAFADPRLDGKRSKRVELLCRTHDGKGSPCDFLSVHAYNTSELMAAKLIRAKQLALEMDPEYFADLWINSHESCPGWNMPPDPAFGDSYLGNGYFPTWCCDVARRQLQQATADKRFAFGETILTLWPWPNTNFGGGNAATRVIHVDDDGDRRADRTTTIAMPILHFLGLLNSMGPDYWVLPEQTVDAHVVSGFASRNERDLRLLVYSHDPLDTDSRCRNQFQLRWDLSGMDAGAKVRVRQYRFDKDYNSYYTLARPLREKQIAAEQGLSSENSQRIAVALEGLESDSSERQLQSLRELAGMGRQAKSAVGTLLVFASRAKEEVRTAAVTTIQQINSPEAYPADLVRRIERLAGLLPTAVSEYTVGVNGQLRLDLRVAANGANFVIIEPN